MKLGDYISKFSLYYRMHGLRYSLKRTYKKINPLGLIMSARKQLGHTSELLVLQQIADSYIHRGREKTIELENIGLQIVPLNYYSPIPSVEEIEKGWEARTPQPFFEPEIYNAEGLRMFLQLLMPYSKEFNPVKDGDENNTDYYFWNNSQFSHSNAMSLYCIVRHIKPKRVLEIGGGFSTLIIDQAIKKNGFGEIWEIEPYPRPFLQKITSIKRFFKIPVQNIPLTLFEELRTGDIFFIDSTHTVKPSSDCTFIYLKALKKLQAGIFIHSHDIFYRILYPCIGTWIISYIGQNNIFCKPF